MRAALLTVSSLLFGFAACTHGVRPEISTQCLARPCPVQGCGTGQFCMTAAGPGGETSTCEIRCDADSDCPRQFSCNLPPIVPDALANVCIPG